MTVRLYVLPGSHPSMTARLMLEHKGIPCERVDLVPGMHRLVLRMKGFPGITVPSIDIDGTRITGSRRIAAALDERFPDRPLYPRDPGLRARVEQAEAWGDEVFQPVPRRIVWWCIRRDASCADGFLDGARLPLPAWLVTPLTPVVAAMSARRNGATDEAVARDLATLPGHLDRIDGFLADGVIGRPELSAADFQIATSLRLLGTIEDLRPLFAGRRLEGYAERVVPSYPGRVRPVIPRELLAATRRTPDGERSRG